MLPERTLEVVWEENPSVVEILDDTVYFATKSQAMEASEPQSALVGYQRRQGEEMKRIFLTSWRRIRGSRRWEGRVSR
jgi:hypothetical protein